MIETLTVTAIVLWAAWLAGRSLYRSVTGGNDGCSCTGTCVICACKQVPEKICARDAGAGASFLRDRKR